jgi:hypothetical protein
MNYFRKLDRKWSLEQARKKGIKSLLIKIFLPFRIYAEWIVGTIPRFMAALFLWPFTLGLVSYFFGACFKQNDNSWLTTIWDHWNCTFIMFFGIQPMHIAVGVTSKIITMLLMGSGFVHLGIFLMFLYTWINKGRR